MRWRFVVLLLVLALAAPACNPVGPFKLVAKAAKRFHPPDEVRVPEPPVIRGAGIHDLSANPITAVEARARLLELYRSTDEYDRILGDAVCEAMSQFGEEKDDNERVSNW